MQLKVIHTSAHIFQNLNAGIVHVESSTSPLNSILLSKGNNYKDKKANKQTKKPFLQTVFHQHIESKIEQIKSLVEIHPVQQTSWNVNTGSSRPTSAGRNLGGSPHLCPGHRTGPSPSSESWFFTQFCSWDKKGQVTHSFFIQQH